MAFNNGSKDIGLAEDFLTKKLFPWIENVPDYYDVTEAYALFGNIKKKIRRKRQEISEAEEEVTLKVDRPRSNEAKVEKLQATKLLKRELAELEATHDELEQKIKYIEYKKSMFSSALYASKMKIDIA